MIELCPPAKTTTQEVPLLPHFCGCMKAPIVQFQRLDTGWNNILPPLLVMLLFQELFVYSFHLKSKSHEQKSNERGRRR